MLEIYAGNWTRWAERVLPSVVKWEKHTKKITKPEKKRKFDIVRHRLGENITVNVGEDKKVVDWTGWVRGYAPVAGSLTTEFVKLQDVLV